MITVKSGSLGGSAKKYASFMKFGKFSFVRKSEVAGTFSVSIPMLGATFAYDVEANSNSEMDVVQSFCTALAKALG